MDYLPAAHGSAIFTRGETQSLTSVTLGTKLDEKQKDEVLVQGTEQFVLHYNFPPFSTGEAKAARGLSRREIGHGHLAWRALKPMVPLGEENPYAVRIVSDILESNGSSSMATVCAGTLALMDAGVKLKKPVSGIAMGRFPTPRAANGPYCRTFWAMRTTSETWHGVQLGPVAFQHAAAACTGFSHDPLDLLVDLRGHRLGIAAALGHGPSNEHLFMAGVEEIAAEREETVKRAFEDALMEQVAENITADVPDAMVEAQSRQFLDNFKMQLAQQGLQYDQYMKATGMDEAQLLADAKEPALKQVRMDLAMAAIIKDKLSPPLHRR